MDLKKIKVSNSRFLFLPHKGQLNWELSLGLLINKMEKETPFISANPICQIMVLSQDTLLVGKEVIGPIREDVKNLLFADFQYGDLEILEISKPEISFEEIYSKGLNILGKRPDLNPVFMIRVSLNDPLSYPLELRFFPETYPFPKLTF